MIFLDNTTLWLWLHSKCFISRSKQYKLIEHFGDIESVYKANLADYVELDILNGNELGLVADKSLDSVNEELSRLKNLNGWVITIDSDDYPDFLRRIHSPPNVLYCRGKHFDLNSEFMIAMVGTRKATDYGKTCAFNIAKELSKAGAVVVSGLAMGIDAYSHKGALAGGSPTIAVLGCGVDLVYPKINAALTKEISDKGLIISEYPLSTPAEKYYFPERNRIISGMCHGTIVVEADYKSGSLITAKYATEQNRDVFAVPGNVNSTYSKGSNYLLKDGAHLVTTGLDVLKFYEFDYPELTASAPEANKEIITDTDNLSPEERIILALGEETLHKDTICERTGLDIGTLNSTLLIMEISGKVIKLTSGYYSNSK